MRILLLGEYSNVHNTLARGLKELGHEVTVASNGDFWKDYPRDIDLQRKFGFWGTLSFLWRLLKALFKMRGYDVVQIINPMFVELKAERIIPIYKWLRKHNKKVVMCAMGMDYYWADVNSTLMPMRYSDFNIGKTVRRDEVAEHDRTDWVGTAKQHLNEYVAHDCDAIVAGLYEYYLTYQLAENGQMSSKTHYIALPIDTPDEVGISQPDKLNLFIGISKSRSVYKGTDIMLRAAKDLEKKYPEKVKVNVAEGIPFAEYQKMLDGSDVLLDQLYGYTPGMNALLGMSKGIISVGGGEPELYELQNEHVLRPIINVEPSYESVFTQLEQIVLHPERTIDLKRQSFEYVRKHHDYLKVTQQYLDVYEQITINN